MLNRHLCNRTRPQPASARKVEGLAASTLFAAKRIVGSLGVALLLQACASRVPPTKVMQPTCLALSVGGPAGVAHLGAIQAIRNAGVDVSCVVGTSMGSLVGVLYAVDPRGNTTRHFEVLMAQYVKATKDEAVGRGVVAGLVGLVFLGPFGGLAAGTVGAVTVNKLEHKRLITVLDRYLSGRSIEQLKIPYETAYVRQSGAKVAFVRANSGNAAAAVGASVANPLIFRELDVRGGGPIDPGLDRVAAVPIEHACTSFPDRTILAVNVTGDPSFVSTRMQCPAFEIPVHVPSNLPAAEILTVPQVFQRVVAIGREATDAWLQSEEGVRFLATAKRTETETPQVPSPSAPSSLAAK